MSGRRPSAYLRSRLAVFAGIAVFTAAQGFAVVYAQSENWVGSWSSSSAIVGWATLWGTGIAAGLAAWVVAAPRRGNFAGFLATSARSQARVYRPALLPVAAGNVMGYLVVLGYVVVMTAPRATHGFLDGIELLPTLAWVPMAVGTGAVIGRFVPAMIAPLVAAVTPFLFYMGGNYVDGYLNRTLLGDLMPIDNSARDYLRFPADLLILKSILWCVLGAALLAWMLGVNRLAYSLAVLAGFAAAGAFTVTGARDDVPAAYHVVCTEGALRVCVDRAHDHILEEYRDRVTAGLAPLSDLRLSSDVTVVQSRELFEFAGKLGGQSIVPPQRQIVVPIAKGYTSPAHEIDPKQFQARLGYGVFVDPCVGADGSVQGKNGQGMALVFYHWWLVKHRLPTNGSNYVGEVATEYALGENPVVADVSRHFLAMSDVERNSWFAGHRNEVLACQVDELG